MRFKKLTNKQLIEQIVILNVCSIFIFITGLFMFVLGMLMTFWGAFLYGMIGMAMGILIIIGSLVISLSKEHNIVMLELRREND